jgi:hypothetical protein
LTKRQSALAKAVVAVAALAALGVFFVRSARTVLAEPYEVPRDHLAAWTLAIEPASSASGIVLELRPQRELTAVLFKQVFARTGESLTSPVPAAMPLVLQSEFDRAMAGAFTPEKLLAVAQAAGLETATVVPTCLAHRRVSAPGIVRQVYFTRFDAPAFDTFRREVARQLRDGGNASAFDAAAVSPVVIIAASDAAFSRWLPLRAGNSDDCLAPIVVK